jgi:N-acetylglucosamine-6-phosphate deacetylase
LAPELPGALELIEHLARTGVVAAVGHSDATFAEVETAVAAGLRHATHCYNRMRPLHHREPGVVGAALVLPGLSADVVLDGHHVHPAAAKLLLAAKGAEGVGLITDAMQATGLGDGEYVRPGDRRVTVRDGMVRLDSGALAGSVLTLDQAVRNATRWLGLGLGAAAQLAGGLAARVLGLNEQPALAVGADADICLLDGDGCIAATIVGGQVAYQHRGVTPWKE